MSTGLRIGVVAVLLSGATALSGATGLSGAAPDAAKHTMSWEEALERTSETGESLLVEVGATWCHACNVLEVNTMADSTVQRVLSEGWIVVQVDVDRRPDLHRLFHARGHDGLPTLHLLAPDGREIMRSGYVDAAALVGMLESTRRPSPSAALLPDESAGPMSAPDSMSAPGSMPDPEEILEWAREQLLSEEDSTSGGFGRGSKYIVAPETDFLLALSAAGDERAQSALRRFVAAVTASDVHDAVDGGFHRYSEARDWSAPHYEKLLMVQAVMMELLAADARAHPATLAENLAVARRTWWFLTSALQDPYSGLFFASLGADVVSDSSGAIVEEGSVYYGPRTFPGMISSGYNRGATKSAAGPRRSGPGPAVDRILLADANARLGLALLVCGDVFDDPTFAASGLQLLEGIRAELLDANGDVLRYRAVDGSAVAAVEDIGELGMLALATGDESWSVALATRLLADYVDPEGRLQTPALDSVAAPIADVGDDGARAILFLGELARITGDEEHWRNAERAFLGLRSADPAASPAALGLAAWAAARTRALPAPGQ